MTATSGRAQFAILGENKVQYRKFDWEVLKGPHIDLYFYPEEAELAPTALQYAEESYEVLRLKFSHEVTSRIPLIVYASHSDFEQTNILPFTPPEGLLGVTDFLKRRVTLPFRGNLAEFRHTMRHELVHAFQISLGIDRYNRSPRSSGVAVPLWWTEGLAEYWSAGEDARDEMILRDLVFSGRLPDIDQLTYVTGGIVYPLGGRIHRWLGETYGDWRAAQLYHDLWRLPDVRGCHRGDLRPHSGPALRRVSARHAESVLSGERGVRAAYRGRSAGRRSGGQAGRNAEQGRRPTLSTPRPRAASSPSCIPRWMGMVAPIHWW